MFSLGNRKEMLSFNYFPDKRVKSFLTQSEVFFTDKSICKFNSIGLDTTLLNKYIMQSIIDFKSSQIRGFDNKKYYLSFHHKNDSINTLIYLIFEKNEAFVKLVNLKLVKSKGQFVPTTSMLNFNQCD